MTTFESVSVGEEFCDAFDLYKDKKGRYCYLELCIPVRKGPDANGVEQTVLQRLPRFSKTAIFGTAYFAQYNPFLSFSDEIFDSRIPADVPAESIEHSKYEGPFQLGLSGPAIYFGANNDSDDDDGVIVQEELEEPIIA